MRSHLMINKWVIAFGRKKRYLAVADDKKIAEEASVVLLRMQYEAVVSSKGFLEGKLRGRALLHSFGPINLRGNFKIRWPP